MKAHEKWDLRVYLAFQKMRVSYELTKSFKSEGYNWTFLEINHKI